MVVGDDRMGRKRRESRERRMYSESEGEAIVDEIEVCEFMGMR